MTERIVTLDTETTGLEWKNGDRVIEIGAVEILARRVTGQHYHQYLDPEREIDAEAVAVHGITREMLQNQPKFAEIADAFLDFVRDATVVIHNAGFDVGFLNAELARCGRPPLEQHVRAIVDTMKLAKAQEPTKRASLDALCERYGIDNRHRTLHGALLDAQLLAEVYLAMTRGQETLAIEDVAATALQETQRWQRPPGLKLVLLPANPEEVAAHEAVLAEIDRTSGGKTLWRQLANAPTGNSADACG